VILNEQERASALTYKGNIVTVDESRNPWRTLESKKIYDNAWIGVREDSVIRPDGEQGIYGVVHFKNIAIGILAVEDEHIYLVGQYRYPLEQYSWEIPEGGCAEGEDPLGAARRELEEETGLRAASWEKMGEAHLSNSVSDERAIWFLATGLTKGEQNPEGTEQLQVRRIAFHQALEMALQGEITDALSLLAIMSFRISRE
jgi:8-oxo-dGTP pyrophosphatase MutT (NUDIX family)